MSVALHPNDRRSVLAWLWALEDLNFKVPEDMRHRFVVTLPANLHFASADIAANGRAGYDDVIGTPMVAWVGAS
jgi:hypothetical protein